MNWMEQKYNLLQKLRSAQSYVEDIDCLLDAVNQESRYIKMVISQITEKYRSWIDLIAMEQGLDIHVTRSEDEYEVHYANIELETLHDHCYFIAECIIIGACVQVGVYQTLRQALLDKERSE